MSKSNPEIQNMFEAWQDPIDDSLKLISSEKIADAKRNGLISSTSKMIHRIEAATGEEMMTEHHRLMGWEAYKPVGKALP